MKRFNSKIKNYVLIAMLAFLFVQLPLPNAIAEESTADTEQVLVFLKDVIGVDLEKYDVELVNFGVQDFTDEKGFFGNLGYIETTGRYTFDYWDATSESYSFFDSNFRFVDNILVDCTFNTIAGSITYSNKLSGSSKEAHLQFLDRYRAFTNDAKFDVMKSLLQAVDETKNSTLKAENFTLKTTVTSDKISLRWTMTYNDVEYSSFNLRFENGTFSSFTDTRSYRKIGSTEVNISKEQAISKALEIAAEYSYNYSGKQVSGFKIINDQIRTDLNAKVRDAPQTYYPCWIIDLPLNETYPGSVYIIRVMFWADTGEAISCKALGYGGSIPNENDNSTNPVTSQPAAASSASGQIENSVQPPSAGIIALVVAAVLIPLLAAGVVLISKRRTKLRN